MECRSVQQRAAHGGGGRVKVGYVGPLYTAPVTSEDERAFLLEPGTLRSLSHVRTLEQVLHQVLGRKVLVVERSNQWGTPVPFE